MTPPSNNKLSFQGVRAAPVDERHRPNEEEGESHQDVADDGHDRRVLDAITNLGDRSTATGRAEMCTGTV